MKIEHILFSAYSHVCSAQKLDREVKERIHLAEENCILINNRNTKPERDRANRKRMESRARLGTARKSNMDELNEIDSKLQQLTQEQKDGKDRAKELREKKKELRTVNGIKRTSPKKVNARGKARLPVLDEFPEATAGDSKEVFYESGNLKLAMLPSLSHDIENVSLLSSLTLDSEPSTQVKIHSLSHKCSLTFLAEKSSTHECEAPHMKSPQTPGPSQLPFTTSTNLSTSAHQHNYKSPYYPRTYFLPPASYSPNSSPIKSAYNPYKMTLDKELDPTVLFDTQPQNRDFDVTEFM